MDLFDVPINPNYKTPETIPPAVPIERFNQDPDYRPPFSEITYEVEYLKPGDEMTPQRDGAEWWKARLDFGETSTDDYAQAVRVRESLVGQGYKARVIRVETIRSQIAV